VWTVQDGHTVVRAVRTASGTWNASPVNASELANMGTITQLRLSRDGVRVAAVVSGRSGPSGAEGTRVVIGSVVRNNDSVTIFAPHTIQSTVDSVEDLDWFSQDKLVVVSAKNPLPVGTMPVDGLTFDRIDNANLSPPIAAVAAAPNRDLIVVDRHDMWTTTEEVQSWRATKLGPEAIPFYPG
jgi:hypothetical protein